MTMTETKTWITSKTIAIAARIPHSLHDKIEAYGLDNFPKGDGKYDKTATIIDLISKGLGLDDVSQSVKQSVNQLDVEQLVKQTVKQELSNTVNQSVKQDNLGTAIANHPTIQSMQAHLKKLDSCKDDLMRAIKDMKEVKAVSDPIPSDVPEKDKTLTNEVTLISNEGKETLTLENKPSSDALESPLTENQDESIREVKEAVSGAKFDKPKTQGSLFPELESEDKGFTDKELAEYLTEQGRKTTQASVNRWRHKKRKPSGQNEKIFSEFEIRGDHWFPKNFG